jgi:uncharacterized protein (TIGR02246 family)
MFRWGTFCLLTLAQSIFALEKGDEDSIKGVIQGYTRAWNERACVGFADEFTQDADFVNIFGMKFSGKEEIEARHREILQTFLKDSKMEILKVDLREVQAGLVIANVYWRVNGFKGPGTIQDGIFTQVFVHPQDKWQITASQNTLIR